MRHLHSAVLSASLIGLACIPSATAQSTPPPTLYISTIAGTGTPGYGGDGGPATWAQLQDPTGLSVDSSGNLYIADYGNCVLRKVTAAGAISTTFGTHLYFGTGPNSTCVSTDPTGVAAGSSGLFISSLSASSQGINGLAKVVSSTASPLVTTYDNYANIALDSRGDIFIVDTNKNSVLEYHSGNLWTVAGNGANVGSYSGDGGPATDATLNQPNGVAVDALGDIFIADSGNNVVRKVDPRGYISTVAGSRHWGYTGDGGSALDADLEWPMAVTVDTAGNLYIADFFNAAVRKVDPSGIITTVAGNGHPGYAGDGGPATSAQLYLPSGVAVDGSGNLYIADSGNSAVRKVSTARQAAPPAFTPNPGTFSTSTQPVTLSDSTEHATIYYTLDGTSPGPGNPSTYTYIGGSIPVQATTTITAKASAPDTQDSNLVVGTYTLKSASTQPPIAIPPTFSPAPGKYTGSVTVTLSDMTPNYRIHYTLDGTTPLASSPVYTGPITLTASTALRAIATAGGYWKSPVVMAQYSVVPQTPTPVISPASGSYSAGQLISISNAIPTATIRYTTDGSLPTTASRLYTGPFVLGAGETVQAISISTGAAESNVASATYTVQ